MLKSIGKSIFVGVCGLVLVFMFVLIHGWATSIMFTLTAMIFFLAGISTSKWNREVHWYSGLLVALPTWIYLSTGQSSNDIALLPLIGLVSASVGSFVSSHLTLTRKEGGDKPNRSRVFSITGALCLILPILYWGLWIYTTSSHLTLPPQETTEVFLSYFPEFFRNVHTISLSVLILLVSSVVLSSIAFKQNRGWPKIMNTCVIILGGLIALLQLFTML